MAPLPNCFLCFSCAITYVIVQRKMLGGGAIADGETDAKNASVDGPLAFLLRNHARDLARKAKGAVGRRRHHGQRNACKKRKWKRPLKAHKN
jgi:hypothetical protein